MRMLACILWLSLAGPSVAAADDGKPSGVSIRADSLVVMRALVPAGEIDGHEAFGLCRDPVSRGSLLPRQGRA